MGREKYKILKINDSSDSYVLQHELFNLPTTGVIVGRSGLSGKSTLMINILEFYKDLVEPSNIFIICPTIAEQEKWAMAISYFDIPEDNIKSSFDENEVREIYLMLKEEFIQDKNSGKTPKQSLLIYDDLGYTDIFASRKKKGNIIDEIVMQGRHVLISSFTLIQYYTQLAPKIRENCKVLMAFSSSQRQIDMICEDFCKISDKKQFIKEFKRATMEPHDFFFVSLAHKGDGHSFYHNFTDPILVDEEVHDMDHERKEKYQVLDVK